MRVIGGRYEGIWQGYVREGCFEMSEGLLALGYYRF